MLSCHKLITIQFSLLVLSVLLSCNNPVNHDNASDELIDIEGNVYKTIRIGNQEWTAENIRTTKYNDGTPISFISSDTMWELCNSTQTGAFCYYNNTTDFDSIKKFGALYNWYVVDPTNTKKIAPEGWHVPTDADWTELENYLIKNGYICEGTTPEIKIGKSLAAKTDWRSAPEECMVGKDLTRNNSTGFTALPGGKRTRYTQFSGMGDRGMWWSSTEKNTVYANSRQLQAFGFELESDHSFHSYDSFKEEGLSLRLIRD